MPNDKDVDNLVDVAVLKVQVHDLIQEVESLKKDRNNALVWGIAVLGTAVVSMGVWIFKLFEKML